MATRMTELSLGVRPRNLSDVVFEAIRQAIVDRVLAPGEPLTEPALAERLKVSKTPVREALLRLRQIGLIEQNGARGLCVIQPSAAAVRQAYELREALESFTAARAAERASNADRERIARAAQSSLDAARKSDIAAFRDSDREFHSYIAELGDNARIASLIDDAGAVISTLMTRELTAGDDLVGCSLGHVAVAEAITASDGVAAAREMTTHIRLVWKLALERLAPGAEA
ncbi:GntR family transcriptional regulator [Capillimicrobium parvum]|uniref:HTH-type transcriptional repressor RspR n=1 Tax=Capillimicrobium parvum TaxID=2884022 RepID=A0A9E7C335_9ACTN|nr:GntR family transcriptional regulator [Capillimicrobium parvum]UGS38232.1 HTH-type transcriptional repressor RspR [Capillimicrobium parvum]